MTTSTVIQQPGGGDAGTTGEVGPRNNEHTVAAEPDRLSLHRGLEPAVQDVDHEFGSRTWA